ncbi:MAG: hypothetical protein S4CHLAM7_10080 [Chlamydiae bacterium]|nr:hypothetical protein [Chlamydiota bacterium]
MDLNISENQVLKPLPKEWIEHRLDNFQETLSLNTKASVLTLSKWKQFLENVLWRMGSLFKKELTMYLIVKSTPLHSWRARVRIRCVVGGSGIRTHGTFSHTHAFQACSFGRSDTPPEKSVDFRPVREKSSIEKEFYLINK